MGWDDIWTLMMPSATTTSSSSRAGVAPNIRGADLTQIEIGLDVTIVDVGKHGCAIDPLNPEPRLWRKRTWRPRRSASG
jgi:hypothetical protein